MAGSYRGALVEASLRPSATFTFSRIALARCTRLHYRTSRCSFRTQRLPQLWCDKIQQISRRFCANLLRRTSPLLSTMAASTSRKRQYQPSVTSYFNRDAGHSSTTSSRPMSPLSPPLPAETQASLLSVGMRVRKSVPEGYKTHKTLSSPGFPFPSTAPVASTSPARPLYNTPSSRELTPFCGLHKVGGWASQPVPSSSAPSALGGVNATDEDDCNYEDMPALSMSQTTTPSTQGSLRPTVTAAPRPSNKRSYEDEIEDDLDAYFVEIEAEDIGEVGNVQGGNVHSMSHNTMMKRSPNARTQRPIAKMKLSVKGAATTGGVNVVGNHDFEEATFLAPVDGMELDDDG